MIKDRTVESMPSAPRLPEAPKGFACPITQEIMRDPVCTLDGHTFERSSIENWFREGRQSSPVTNQHLGSTALAPNHALRNAIDEWRSSNYKEVPRSAIDLGEQIGAGSFKRVYQGRLKLPGSSKETVVAVLNVFSGNVAAEAATLMRVGRHPRLVRYLGMSTEESETLILLEYATMGSLLDKMEEIEDSITLGHQIVMLQQIASGMEALASAALIHRDLALRNILLFNYDESDVSKTSVKVSDFGLTVNAYTATAAYVQGGPKPVRWLAPEALKKGRYSEKSDVWAYGVTAWELLSNGTRPYFYLANDDAVILEVTRGNHLTAPDELSANGEGLWSLMEPCFQKVPASRPTFSELLINLSTMQPPVGSTVESLSAERVLWESADKKGLDKQKLFLVQKGSNEFLEIQAHFAATLPQRRIVKLERVENGFQHEAFSVHARGIAEQLGEDYDATTMRRRLFHGTAAVDAIINGNTAGFLPLLSGTCTGAIYGDGTYFARDASYSDDYAVRVDSGLRQMLLVDVVLGKWAQGKRGMKKYPLRPGHDFACYTSLANRVEDPSIFVVQHSSQAYPEYLITYTTLASTV